MGDASHQGVFPDALPVFAVLRHADADAGVKIALCGFEAVVELEVDEVVFT